MTTEAIIHICESEERAKSFAANAILPFPMYARDRKTVLGSVVALRANGHRVVATINHAEPFPEPDAKHFGTMHAIAESVTGRKS